ncbi:MAG: carbohydrate-binding protein, partial [Planctomycetota bacterium]
PAGSLDWSVVFHHLDHTHPFIPSISGTDSITFTIPDAGETSPIVWYRVRLTATDSQGLTQDTFIDLQPTLSTITLRALVDDGVNPPAPLDGLDIFLDGTPQPDNTDILGVVGINRSLVAPLTRTIDGQAYEFIGWDHGGESTQVVATPPTDTTYTARFRPVASVGQQPYYGTPFPFPGRLQAEDYDIGGEGVAYSDTSPDNNVSNAYRDSETEGVDVEESLDAGGGHHINVTKAGEWVEYTVDVPAAGNYLLRLRVSNRHPAGILHVEFDGEDKTGPWQMPQTANWQVFTTVERIVSLEAGPQVMRVSFDEEGPKRQIANLNWIELEPLYGSAPDAPTELQLTGLDESSVTVSWTDRSINEQAFVVQRKPAVGGAWTTIATLAAEVTSYKDESVASETDYLYRVQATNIAGASGFTNELAVTTPPQVDQDPFGGTPHPVPGRIEIEHADTGGQFISFFDTDGDDVDIYNAATASNGQKVGFVRAGEWIEYTINVATAGDYLVALAASSDGDGGTVHFEQDGVDLTGPIDIPDTEDWDNFQTVVANLTLSAGVQVIRLSFDTAGGTGFVGDFDYFELLPDGGQPILPAAPTGLSAQLAATDEVDLNWTDASFNEDGFRVYRSVAGGPFTLLATLGVGATTYRDTGLAADTAYVYRVDAFNAAGGSASNTASITTPPIGGGQTPFGGTPHAVPGTIEAEDFDEGGQNIAYNDVDTSNNGGAYRTTGVDVQTAKDVGGGFNVGWTRAGEWLEYTVDVATAGTYTLETRWANPSDGGFAQLSVDGVDIGAQVQVPNTGGWQDYQTVTQTVTLGAGVQTLRWTFGTTGTFVGNFNWFRFTPASTGQLPAAPSGLTATALGSSSVQLNWTDNASDEFRFHVLRSTDNVNFTHVGHPGADSTQFVDTGLSPSTTYYYKVAAENGTGMGAFSNTATVTTAPASSNTTPVATITSPATGTTYRAGDTISFAGSVTDAEDGPLPVSSYFWRIKLLDGDHFHTQYIVAGVSSGTYTIPTTPHGTVDIAYQVELTAFDSGGLQGLASVDIAPVVGSFTVDANVPGVTLQVDGAPVAAGTQEAEVSGVVRTIAAPLNHTNAGVAYTFVGWSDGPTDATRSITVGDGNATYVAIYSPVASGQQPYLGSPVLVPGRIEVEDFDTGGQDVAYNDSNTTNSGGDYRATGVDVDATGDGGFYVGWTRTGEWLEYTITVPEAGIYDLDVNLTMPRTGATFSVGFDTGSGLVDVTGPVTVPNTGGWRSWEVVSVPVALEAGTQVMRLTFGDNVRGAVGNFDWIEINATNANPEPPSAPTNPSATALSSSAISVQWTDTSDTELGFEIYRSTDGVNFLLAGTADA